MIGEHQPYLLTILGEKRLARLQAAAQRAEIDEWEFLRRLVDRALKTAPGKAKPELFETRSFLHFWANYPWKAGKLEALKAWHESAAERLPMHLMLAAVERHILYWRRVKERDGKDIIPRASTWLRQRRWEDEVKDEQPTAKSNGGPSAEEKRLEEQRRRVAEGR